MTALSQILRHKIVTIVRGAHPDDVLKIAEALHEGGINVLEVTFNSPNSMEVVNELSSKMGSELLIGMGTVLDAATARQAIEAGARFIISPTYNKETVEITKQLGAVSIPGAFTPTEILNAYSNGGDIIKVFPAAANADYIRDLGAPLPQIPLMPTGGINLNNIVKFFKAGAVAVGIGTALVDTKQKATKKYLKTLTENANEFVKAVSKL